MDWDPTTKLQRGLAQNIELKGHYPLKVGKWVAYIKNKTHSRKQSKLLRPHHQT